jgi:hypothetical protein
MSTENDLGNTIDDNSNKMLLPLIPKNKYIKKVNYN